MNTKRITYLAATLALATAAASCEHEEIYEPLEFSVQLAPTNTYRTGDPVVFNFSGNADFITVWTGDTGHEYKHRNRTKVDIADIESCELEIEISQQYGTLNNLVLFAGNKFAGLNGSDAATDRPVVEAIAANDCADWTKLEFTPNNANKFETYTYDITRFADRFSWGMHLFYPDPKTTMRTYRINPKITVKFKGHDTQVYNYPDMEFVPFSLASQHADNPYIHNVSGNGNLKFQGRPGANNTANIVFQGFSAGAFPEIDQWAFMQPVALNTISPDTGLNIKGVTDDLPSYSYTYTEPGTYTVTFIVAGGNYGQGSSREHAALAPLYLGVKAVLAKSFARIHRANLMNNGILPLEFTDEADYDALNQNDGLVIENAPAQIAAAAEGKCVTVKCGAREIKLRLEITPRQRDILLAGGLLNYTKAHKED